MWKDIEKYLPKSDHRYLISKAKVKDSFQRSLRAGVDPAMKQLTDILTGTELDQFLSRHSHLLHAARDLFERTYQAVSDKSCAFLATDPFGRIIDVYSSPEVIHECSMRRVQRGASLSETASGTNGVSLALYYKDTVVLRGQDHFCELFHDWCCVAVPVFNPEQELVGCIDCSMSHESSLGEKLPLLRMIAEKLTLSLETVRDDTFPKVTPRRENIIRLLGEGRSCKEVAALLDLNPRTVETHLRRMREQWDAKTTCELVSKVLSSGAIPS